MIQTFGSLDMSQCDNCMCIEIDLHKKNKSKVQIFQYSIPPISSQFSLAYNQLNTCSIYSQFNTFPDVVNYSVNGTFR